MYSQKIRIFKAIDYLSLFQCSFSFSNFCTEKRIAVSACAVCIGRRNHEDTKVKARKDEIKKVQWRKRDDTMMKTRVYFALSRYRVFVIVISRFRHRCCVISWFRVSDYFLLKEKMAMPLTEFRILLKHFSFIVFAS
jgi:hypothetical protein